MKQNSITTEQILFKEVVDTLDTRFGVKDLSTHEVLRIYGECREVFSAYQIQCAAIEEAGNDMEKYFSIFYSKFNPVFEVIHSWFRNALNVDILERDYECRNAFRKEDSPLREYIHLIRKQLI